MSDRGTNNAPNRRNPDRPPSKPGRLDQFADDLFETENPGLKATLPHMTRPNCKGRIKLGVLGAAHDTERIDCQKRSILQFVDNICFFTS